MCETNAFIREAGKEEALLDSVARIRVEGDTLHLTNIFGEKKSVSGRIVEVNFQAGKVFVERL